MYGDVYAMLDGALYVGGSIGGVHHSDDVIQGLAQLAKLLQVSDGYQGVTRGFSIQKLV